MRVFECGGSQGREANIVRPDRGEAIHSARKAIQSMRQEWQLNHRGTKNTEANVLGLVTGGPLLAGEGKTGDSNLSRHCLCALCASVVKIHGLCLGLMASNVTVG